MAIKDAVRLDAEEVKLVAIALETQRNVVLRAMRAEKDDAIATLRQAQADRLAAIAAKVREGALF